MPVTVPCTCFRARTSPVGRIELGDDADNIRVDTQANKVFVGYGSGALAVIDPLSRKKITDIALGAHPESFQLDSIGRIYVNVPNAGQIAVVDRAAGEQSTGWSFSDARDNFAMALDENEGRVIVLFRKPARIVAFASKSGQVVFKGETCGDADDAFVDPKRHRIYVSCGAGLIDVLQRRGVGYERVGRIPTAPGARTCLFLPRPIASMLACVPHPARLRPCGSSAPRLDATTPQEERDYSAMGAIGDWLAFRRLRLSALRWHGCGCRRFGRGGDRTRAGRIPERRIGTYAHRSSLDVELRFHKGWEAVVEGQGNHGLSTGTGAQAWSTMGCCLRCAA